MNVILRKFGLFFAFTCCSLRSGGAVVAWLLACILLAPAALAVTNSLTITEKGGIATTNYPIQVGRPFAQGEIANYPQAVVAGAPVATQADVKNRWNDGSVKYAVVAFLIPSLGARATVTVTFQNQTSGNNMAITKAQMMGSAYDFNAQMQLTNASTVSADARTMLNAGDYTLWTQGSVAQTAIIANHAQTSTCNSHPCSTYDIGFDSNKSFRPIIHATFWPTINKVRIRFVGEIASSETLQDQTYSLTLKVGNSSPATVYTKSSFTHRALTRWTRDRNNQSGQTWTVSTPGGNITVEKEIWIGGVPGPVQINHNLAYLASTKAVWNYDTTLTVPEGTIASVYSDYASRSKDINEAGTMVTAMGTAGGRLDIGPFDGWGMYYLYTGDIRMKEASFRNADLAGAYDNHYREGRTDRNITRGSAYGCTYSCDADGTGKILSVTERPTVRTIREYLRDIVPVGTIADPTPWRLSSTHLQEYQTVPYILSGEYWYLEELQFLAGWAISWQPATGAWGRGANGWECAQTNDVEPRQVAWGLRTRAHAAWFSVDATAEKSYYETGLKDAFADMEGEHNLTSSALYNDTFYRTIWNFGKARNVNINYTAEGAPPVWRPFDHGATSASWCGYDAYDSGGGGGAASDCADIYSMQSPWMSWTTTMALGRAKELGYASDAMLTYMAAYLNGMLTSADYNPWLVGEYHIATLKNSPRRWYANWAEVKAAYLDPTRSRTDFLQGSPPPPESYPFNAFAAASFTKDKTDGTAAWNWLNTNVRQVSTTIATNPTWAILPRSAAAPPSSSCDLNFDGRVDLLDVQFAITQALGVTACTNADLDRSGSCTLLDVMRMMNAVTGGACIVGP